MHYDTVISGITNSSLQLQQLLPPILPLPLAGRSLLRTCIPTRKHNILTKKANTILELKNDIFNIFRAPYDRHPTPREANFPISSINDKGISKLPCSEHASKLPCSEHAVGERRRHLAIPHCSNTNVRHIHRHRFFALVRHGYFLRPFDTTQAGRPSANRGSSLLGSPRRR
jgi:hypothetical protein